MNARTIPIVAEGATRQRKREAPKGRVVDAAAIDEVRALLGTASRAPDELIEHLHRLQDRFGHLSARHLAALAREMGLAQTEVYEVATFYHHFDIVKEGGVAPAALTVRVCDGLSCEMAGAQELLAKLPGILGKDVRVRAASRSRPRSRRRPRRTCPAASLTARPTRPKAGTVCSSAASAASTTSSP
jgi:formate dehydrogenase beta subunit